MSSTRLLKMLAIRVQMADEQTSQGISVKVKTVNGEQTLVVQLSEIVPNGSSFHVPKTFVEGAWFGHKEACPLCDKGNKPPCPMAKIFSTEHGGQLKRASAIPM